MNSSQFIPGHHIWFVRIIFYFCFFFRLNATLVYHEQKTKNFPEEMHQKLELGSAQMVVPVLAYSKHDSKYRAEISNSFQRLDFCVAAMKLSSQNSSDWLNSGIFVGHSKYLLLGTIITFAILYKVFWLVHDIFQQQSQLSYELKESNIIAVFFMMYRAFFGDSLTYLPQSSSLRILLIGWILFCFLITSAITANLLSTLVEPTKLVELNGVEDLSRANLKLTIPTELTKKFKDNSPDIWNRLNASVECIPWKDFLNATASRNPSKAYSAADYIIEYIVHKQLNKVTKKPIYYRLNECIFNMFGLYHLEPGSAYLQRINELLGLIHQVGLYQHWFQNAVFNMTATSGFAEDEETDDDDNEPEVLPVVLKLENIRGIFLLWLMGITLAIITFVAERSIPCLPLQRECLCCRIGRSESL